MVSQALGYVGSYHSYLKSWSRIGKISSSNLKSLLQIGNIEAVMAVTRAKNLDDELLDLIWWCATNTDQQAEIGRFLLTRDLVVKHPVGKQIAHYLLEFLPFTNNTSQLMDTTNLVLQNDLISQREKEKLWKQGQRKTAFFSRFY